MPCSFPSHEEIRETASNRLRAGTGALLRGVRTHMLCVVYAYSSRPHSFPVVSHLPCLLICLLSVHHAAPSLRKVLRRKRDRGAPSLCCHHTGLSFCPGSECGLFHSAPRPQPLSSVAIRLVPFPWDMGPNHANGDALPGRRADFPALCSAASNHKSTLSISSRPVARSHCDGEDACDRAKNFRWQAAPPSLAACHLIVRALGETRYILICTSRSCYQESLTVCRACAAAHFAVSERSCYRPDRVLSPLRS